MEKEQLDEMEDIISHFMDAVYHILWRVAPLGVVALVAVQAYLAWIG